MRGIFIKYTVSYSVVSSFVYRRFTVLFMKVRDENLAKKQKVKGKPVLSPVCKDVDHNSVV